MSTEGPIIVNGEIIHISGDLGATNEFFAATALHTVLHRDDLKIYFHGEIPLSKGGLATLFAATKYANGNIAINKIIWGGEKGSTADKFMFMGPVSHQKNNHILFNNGRKTSEFGNWQKGTVPQQLVKKFFQIDESSPSIELGELGAINAKIVEFKNQDAENEKAGKLGLEAENQEELNPQNQSQNKWSDDDETDENFYDNQYGNGNEEAKSTYAFQDEIQEEKPSRNTNPKGETGENDNQGFKSAPKGTGQTTENSGTSDIKKTVAEFFKSRGKDFSEDNFVINDGGDYIWRGKDAWDKMKNFGSGILSNSRAGNNSTLYIPEQKGWFVGSSESQVETYRNDGIQDTQPRRMPFNFAF